MQLSNTCITISISFFSSRSIMPEELSSCSWNKKNKLEVAPNVVALTRRFNHVRYGLLAQILFFFITPFFPAKGKLEELESLLGGLDHTNRKDVLRVDEWPKKLCDEMFCFCAMRMQCSLLYCSPFENGHWLTLALEG